MQTIMCHISISKGLRLLYLFCIRAPHTEGHYDTDIGWYCFVVTTEIAALKEFYYAEDYHQQYFYKNPGESCSVGGGVCEWQNKKKSDNEKKIELWYCVGNILLKWNVN